MFRGYYDNPKATQESFTSDGWLRSGDVGYRNTDMLYWCTDRIKELIKVGLVSIDKVNRRNLCNMLAGTRIPGFARSEYFIIVCRCSSDHLGTRNSRVWCCRTKKPLMSQ